MCVNTASLLLKYKLDSCLLFIYSSIYLFIYLTAHTKVRKAVCLPVTLFQFFEKSFSPS